MTTIFETIRRDHERLRRAIREAKEARNPDDKVASLGRMTRALRIHDDAERSSIYTALLSHERGRELGREATDKHHEIERLMSDLVAMPPESPDRDICLQELAQCLEHHFRWEQERLFPAAHFLFSAQTQQRLARIYEQAKRHAHDVAA